MSIHREIIFHPLPATPEYFYEDKFKAGDEIQIEMYKKNKKPNQKNKLTYEEILTKKCNYARQVPMNGCFLDYDNKEDFEIMKRIIVRAELKCFILKTQRGGQFLFRLPTFYKKELTGATNWFGYKFDAKASWVNENGKEIHAVQNMRVCGMERIEVASWNLDTPILPDTINIDELDELPYWLWGKKDNKDLHKEGKPGKSEYTLDNTPFTQLMEMPEGNRHNHIVERCSMFGLQNGFEIDEFKSLIKAIHDHYLVKLGTPMPDSDLFGDLEERWEDYTDTMTSSGWAYDEKERKWQKLKSKKSRKNK